jgi:hypothetical protein
MLNTCLIISTALALVILLGMIALLKIQNAILAQQVEWQERQIQVLQERQQGTGCGGAILLILLAVIGLILLLMVATAAGVP